MNSGNSINSNNSNISNKNVLPNLKTISFYPIMFLIFVLTIAIFLLMFKVQLPSSQPASVSNSDAEMIANVFIIVFVVLIIVGLCVMFLPNLKDLKEFFMQAKGMTFVILNTIFLILFFRTMSDDIINDYAYIILPITLLITGGFFYNAVKTNYFEQFNINYERIKSIILLFCFITTVIIYYNIDPGGYISEYFGSSMLFTIILSVFALLYIIVLLTLPKKDGKPMSVPTVPKTDNFFANFSKFSVIGSILFTIFLITMTILIATYPGGFMNDTITSTGVIILMFIVCSYWILLLGTFLFPEIQNKEIAIDRINIFKRSLLAIMGLASLGFLLFFIIYAMRNFSGTNLILNIIIILLVLSLIHKTMIVKLPHKNDKKNAFFELMTSVIFYVPCLFTGLFESLLNFGKTETATTSKESIGILILAIVLILLYLFIPSVFNLIYLQGGKLLVNRPVHTDTHYALATYEELHGNETFDYQYAISCWIFMHASGPNTNSSYTKYTTLLNFGDKPHILYNGSTNSLMITMQQKDLKKTTSNNLIEFDENDNRIIFIKDNFLLQKWNNIIINYSGGILDIFLNGELVKSDNGVVPYYTLDNLTIGQDNGIKGGICNVVYFNKALTASNIFILYNMLKNKELPITDESDKTIIDIK